MAIVDVCSGNLRSVERALAAAGADTFVTRDAAELRRADKLVIPGQGALGTFARELAARGLEAPLREELASGKPMLGICLGMQVLFEHGEEHGGIQGLGLLGGDVVKFAASAARKVPHIGWNQIEAPAGRDRDPLLRDIPDGAHVYFVHSYYAVPTDPSVIAVETDYGGRFCAAIRKDNLFACQFHPEKSQHVGLQLLRNFVQQA
ncbi:MAG: imidazole glycerol phosphate synthase subunit HisH [Myxococcales bacterium]|nr:imidazole glycerol phosphate synthase subunit HisH [Myxococcales bacterium]